MSTHPLPAPTAGLVIDLRRHLRAALALLENHRGTRWDRLLTPQEAYLIDVIIAACQTHHRLEAAKRQPATAKKKTEVTP